MADELIAGRYRLIEPLGRGAMSAVWLAEDQELGRRVAVKTLAPSADRQRFEREARAAAALSHPNICSLYDYGEQDGRPYMVLEYLPNGSLEERLKDGKPLPDAETRIIATEVAAGLAHAHDRGLVHRDLKPANILFDAEGRAKIADFGIARMGGTGTLTEAGTVLGTASYISPEQASGQPAGPASDVYSFGVILFRMLTGRLPFVSSNAMELVRMHRDEPPPSVASVRPDAPAALESIAAASLVKDPAHRPADGRALYAELAGDGSAATMIASASALAAPDEAGATHVIAPAAALRPRRARRSLLPVAIIAAVLLLGGVALALALTGGGGGDGGTAQTTNPLTLPNVPSAGSTSTAASTTAPTTTAPTTTAATTTAKTTTAPTTTQAPTTTHRATTTAPTTTLAPPTTTVAPPTTTAPTTTAVTTDTTPTTTAPTTTAGP